MTGGVLGGVLSSTAAPQTAKTNVVPVDGITQQAKLVSQPQPVYPPLAKQARIEGNVELEAVIGAAFATERAESMDTSCSAERPPNIRIVWMGDVISMLSVVGCQLSARRRTGEGPRTTDN